MNKKISKFLICSNPMVGDDQYIFCSRDPEMIVHMHEKDGELTFEILEVYSGTMEDAEKASPRMKDWYKSLSKFKKKL
jgi:hypothetical protein